MNLTRPIEPLTAEAMRPLGYLIEYPGGEGFQSICSETDAVGWQIAANRITNRSVDQLACHPNTMESFEPVSGVAVIVLAAPGAPDEWRAFVLDGPICIGKGVWHATLALSSEAIVKIVENVNVDADFHPLSESIEPLLA